MAAHHPRALALAQPFYCTEAGRFYGAGSFPPPRTDKESYILFYTRRGAGLIEQNSTQVLLPEGQALLLNCRTPQSYCTAPGRPAGTMTGCIWTEPGCGRWRSC